MIFIRTYDEMRGCAYHIKACGFHSYMVTFYYFVLNLCYAVLKSTIHNEKKVTNQNITVCVSIPKKGRKKYENENLSVILR